MSSLSMTVLKLKLHVEKIAETVLLYAIKIAFTATLLGKGSKKNTENYPLLVDKGGGRSSKLDKRWGLGGSPGVDIKIP